MKKFIVAIIFIITGGFIFYSVNYVDNGNNDYSNIEKEYNRELLDLKEQKEQIQSELDLFDDDYSIPNMGSVVFMLSDTNKKHLEDSIPQLESNGYHGVIALSASNMPSDRSSKYLTKQDIDDLIEKGYEILIRLGTNESPKDVYDIFIEEGYDVKGFYLPNSSSSIETIQEIKNIGDMIIIGNFGDYIDEDIMLIEKYGSMFPNVKNKFFDSIDESEIIAISVGYSDDLYEEYEYVNFTTMLNVINQYVDENKTDVCNISEAKNRYEVYLDYLESIKNEDRIRIKELEDKMNEIDEQMIFD